MFWNDLAEVATAAPAGPAPVFGALGASLPHVPPLEAGDAKPYGSSDECFHEQVRLIAARAEGGIAQALRDGRMPHSYSDAAIAAEAKGLVASLGRRGRAPVSAEYGPLAKETAARMRASLAAGMRLSLWEVGVRFSLTSLELQVVVAVAAPYAGAEVGRLFGLLSNDPNRPLVDTALLVRLFAGCDLAEASQVRRYLAPGATLRRYGLINAAGDGAYDALTVDPVLIARLRGEATPLSAGTSVREAFSTYDELFLPIAVRTSVARGLSAPRPAGQPSVIVLRGRRGAGRRSLAAALAATVGRRITVIDASATRAANVAAELDAELRRAMLRETVPCVVNIEPAVRERDEVVRLGICRVISSHPGTVFVCAQEEDDLLFSDLAVDVTIDALGVVERTRSWQAALPRLGEGEAAMLAERLPVSPGIAQQIGQRALTREAPDLLQACGRVAAGDVLDAVKHIAHARTWAFEAPLVVTGGTGTEEAFGHLQDNLLQGVPIRALLAGPRGAGKSHAARAVVSPRACVAVDTPSLLGGDAAVAAARFDRLIEALDGAPGALVLERLDELDATVAPAVLRRAASQLNRLRAGVIGICRTVTMPLPLDELFTHRIHLTIDPATRAVAWRVLLGDRGGDADVLARVAARWPLGMHQICMAARALEHGVGLVTEAELDAAARVVSDVPPAAVDSTS